MRTPNVIQGTIFLVIMFCGHQSVAREVTVLEFDARSEADANNLKTAKPDTQPEAAFMPHTASVNDVMLLEFSRSTAPIKMAAIPFSLGPLPTDALRIPAWMTPRPTILQLPLGSSAVFASGLAGGRYDRCDTLSYAPAWWLDARTEERRIAYYATIAAVACEYGVPTALLDAVVAQESRYKSWAISPKGAMGLMQIMPGTASQLGLATPFDPIANLRAGARYLRMQLDRFGRVELALAAYNAGPHRRSLKEGRLPPFTETRNYVRTIMVNWERLARPSIEIASVDRGAIAAEAVAASPLRTATLARYDGTGGASSF